jgi:serine/threonine protein kinase
MTPATLSENDSFGGFVIVSELGEGGMGVVYLAEERRLGRRVALKLIAPQLSADDDFHRRFEAEARSAAAIEHPNAVPIYSSGDVDGQLYIAMRYIDGTDLRTLLRREHHLSPVVAAKIVSEIGSALDAAHAIGLIHRDVKPANILIGGSGRNQTAYLTDFGLTKGLEESRSGLTGTGQFVGTLNYVAPEQLSGGRIDARTDVYALGCVLYEMLAGQVPFGGTDAQKMWCHTSTPVPSLVEAGIDQASAFDQVISRATAKDPDDRFPSAGDLGRAAVAAAQGWPVEAPERSVARGVAASGLPAIPTQPLPPPSPPPGGATTRRLPRHAARRPSRAQGSNPSARVAAIIAVAVVLAAGLVAGALVIGGGGKTSNTKTIVRDGRTTTSRTPTASQPTNPNPRVGGGGGGGASAAAETVPSLRPFADLGCACSAVRPVGGGWSAPVYSQPTPNRIFRTTFSGPNGEEVLIDWTPQDAPEFGGTADSQQIVQHPVFGPMTEYAISPGGSDLVMCQSSFCSELVIPLDSNSGWAVVAGGFDDPVIAQQLARQIATSLSFYDV